MEKPQLIKEIRIKERCKICGKIYIFNTDNFRWCIYCSDYYCKNCSRPCESCLLRTVCILCAEKFRDKYKSVLKKHRCEQCSRLFSNL